MGWLSSKPATAQEIAALDKEANDCQEIAERRMRDAKKAEASGDYDTGGDLRALAGSFFDDAAGARYSAESARRSRRGR